MDTPESISSMSISMKQTTKRKISAGLALVLAILVVAGFLFLIFPSITDSIVKLSTQIGDYAMNAEVMIQDVIKTYPQTADPIYLTKIKNVLGHTWVEVAGGILHGLIIASILYFVK